jgi:hypothetical protein
MTKAERAEQMRREAERLAAEALKEERLSTADKVPTCPHCGGRVFKVGTWTTVCMSIAFDDDDPEGEWCDDYESGDHTDQNAFALCCSCLADVEDVLRRHGWTFYHDPRAKQRRGGKRATT